MKQTKAVFKLPPIMKVPKFATKLEMTSHLNSEDIRHYRPQAKVVKIVSSRMSDAEFHEGTMFRKRMSKKKNKYKQVIKPNNKHLPPLFMLDD